MDERTVIVILFYLAVLLAPLLMPFAVERVRNMPTVVGADSIPVRRPRPPR